MPVSEYLSRPPSKELLALARWHTKEYGGVIPAKARKCACDMLDFLSGQSKKLGKTVSVYKATRIATLEPGEYLLSGEENVATYDKIVLHERCYVYLVHAGLECFYCLSPHPHPPEKAPNWHRIGKYPKASDPVVTDIATIFLASTRTEPEGEDEWVSRTTQTVRLKVIADGAYDFRRTGKDLWLAF